MYKQLSSRHKWTSSQHKKVAHPPNPNVFNASVQNVPIGLKFLQFREKTSGLWYYTQFCTGGKLVYEIRFADVLSLFAGLPCFSPGQDREPDKLPRFPEADTLGMAAA